MGSKKELVETEGTFPIFRKDIQNLIHAIRGVQVMLDRDLAKLYRVETRVLNQAVKRNKERFPQEYCFQLTDRELESWKSQIVMSKADKKGLKRPPYVFTEQGVAMLSAVLRSDTAVKVSIQIMNAFVAMRRFLMANAQIFPHLDSLEMWKIETDEKMERVLAAIELSAIQPRQGIFFDGQIFDSRDLAQFPFYDTSNKIFNNLLLL